ncbi:MAG: 3-dehydroquinate synthase [Byssovorax sp.]
MIRQRKLLIGGFMGVGKSTVARRAAELSGIALVDLDAAIEARAGKPIAAIFADDGEAAFRALEAAELAAALAADGPAILALGGGALLDQARRRDALGQAFVVTLTARPGTIADRTAGSTRPLLAGAVDRAERIRELLDARAHVYAEAHAQVPTDDHPIDAVAEAVLQAWSQPTLAVPLGPRSYTVQLTVGAPATLARVVKRLRPSAVFVVTDENVQRFWGDGLTAALAAAGVPARATVVLRPGEEHKRLAAVEQALTAMVEAGADRDAVVLGHGGGVVTDIAGFTAATLLRGVRWVAAPTTLLAMVDASVGGKTGVDLGLAKNAIGAFHQPSAVVIDTAHVTTETPRAYISGLAEVVKSAALADPALFAVLEAEAPRVLARELAIVEELVLRSVAVKAAIVARDERESGDRALLNFGHTLGHALEAEGGFTRLTHGEAVSLGMVAMLRAGRALGVTDAGDEGRVVSLLARLGLPVDLDAQPLAAALGFVALDKKRRGAGVRAVFLRRIGSAFVRETPLVDLPGLLGVGSQRSA